MNKVYFSLGLMSGTSMDGVDASIIASDCDKKLEIIDNCYRKYDDNFKTKLRQLIGKIRKPKHVNNNKNLFKNLTKELTTYHAKVSQKIINRNKNIKIDFIGFHGQTIAHNPRQKFSIQMGDPKLLSKLLKKRIYFNFRKNDIANGGEGAPLTPIYHHQIFRRLKLKLPTIFLNIGGIANITYINLNQEIKSFDIGPGNCLIDKWIYQNIKKDFDKNGLIAQKGKIDRSILKQKIKKSTFLKSKQKSFDINDFDISLVKDLNLEDGAATLTAYTGQIIAEKINKFSDKKISIILCGGGRKNKFLIKNILKKIKYNLRNIDALGINGDYVESQAFAYLAIRSYLKKEISFPSTTGVKFPVSGGEMFENY